MASVKRLLAQRTKMADRAQQMMDFHFPNFPPQLLWHRRTHNGYTTLPRTLPIAMQIIDMQSKGQPPGHTLLCLWARAPDHPLIIIESPTTYAAEAGFLGERAVDTWRRRMRKLRELGFIMTKKGSSGEFHYVLLLNPNAAVEQMNEAKLVQETIYSRFLERLMDIGASKDIQDIRQHIEEQRAQAVQSTSKPEIETAVTAESAKSKGKRKAKA